MDGDRLMPLVRDLFIDSKGFSQVPFANSTLQQGRPLLATSAEELGELNS